MPSRGFGCGYAALCGDNQRNARWQRKRRVGPYNCRVLTADEFIRDASLAMQDRYTGDCATYACRVAELLIAAGRSAWIGQVRHVTTQGEEVMHWPLIPRRFIGRGAPAWTTHYVACSGRIAYDPLVGVPIHVEWYALEVFGWDVSVEVHLDEATTERLLLTGEIRQTFRPARPEPG